jgi:hypothetical protein
VTTARDGHRAVWRYLYTDFVEVEVAYKPYVDNSFASILIGENQGDLVGWSVNSSGDVNTDGFDDAIVGAPGSDDNTGKAYLIFGHRGLHPKIPVQDANVSIQDGESGDRFGYSVGSVDMVSDGYSDIIVGAPFNDSLDGSRTDAGAVYVYYGSASLNGMIQGANFTRSGENAYDHLGWSVANAANVNIDNHFEIIVGAPHYDNGSIQDVGKAYVFNTIPEFDYILLPIILMSMLMLVIRKRKIRG